ncbi:MAG: bifunctional pyr operon transcriptional regulator/uracil phosphoribosyltransferase PyrR [Fimbriimonadaceae bacterium]
MRMSLQLMSAEDMRRTLGRIAYEVVESNHGSQDLVVVGVLRRGWPLAKRLAFLVTQLEGATAPCGKLDISAYRDDRKQTDGDETEIPFEVTGKNVLLVDEVIYTGRTARAALEALTHHGRPARVQLAVLVDRGFRELPIQPDFVGRRVETLRSERVEVLFNEYDGEDAVRLVSAAGAAL